MEWNITNHRVSGRVIADYVVSFGDKKIVRRIDYQTGVTYFQFYMGFNKPQDYYSYSVYPSRKLESQAHILQKINKEGWEKALELVEFPIINETEKVITDGLYCYKVLGDYIKLFTLQGKVYHKGIHLYYENKGSVFQLSKLGLQFDEYIPTASLNFSKKKMHRFTIDRIYPANLFMRETHNAVIVCQDSAGRRMVFTDEGNIKLIDN